MEQEALNTSTRYSCGDELAVEAEHISFAYPQCESVIDDVSFSVKRGEIFVIAGLSGCGKTTLCSIICGIIPNVIQGTLSGDVKIMGRTIANKTLAETAGTAAMVFQNADMQLICTTVEDELAFGLENLCVEPEKIRRLVDESLEHWGLEKLRLCDPGRLSGGQKKLTAMAAVLMLEPQVLILDEPMCQLDREGRAMVKNAVLRLKSEGKTIIMVEHDLSLAGYADHWMLMENGKVAAIDTPEKLMSDRIILEKLELI